LIPGQENRPAMVILCVMQFLFYRVLWCPAVFRHNACKHYTWLFASSANELQSFVPEKATANSKPAGRQCVITTKTSIK